MSNENPQGAGLAPPDVVRSLLVQAAAGLLEKLPQLACEMSVVLLDPQWRVCIQVQSAVQEQPKEPEVLTDCERDVLAVLTGHKGYATTSMVLDMVQQAGFLHGESTIRHALPGMVERGILANRRRAPRGYYVPGKSGGQSQ